MSAATDPLVETEQRLVARYAEHGVDADEVRRHVSAARHRLDGARISSFLPVLVERSVHRALAA